MTFGTVFNNKGGSSQLVELRGRRPVAGGGFRGVRVEIDGGVISKVESTPGLERSWPIISPGFIELQCNGALGRDFSDPSMDPAPIPEYLAATGVTAYLATVVTAAPEAYPRLLRRLRGLSALSGALCLGVHLEGPFLNPNHSGAHNPHWIRGMDPRAVKSLAVEPVRLVTLAPELEGGGEACARFRAAGIVVSAGHSGASYQEALRAFDAGVSAGTHLFNAMPPLHHREPGLAGALLERSAPPAGLIPDGRHVHPAMVRLAWAARGPEGIFLVTDAIPAVGLPQGEYWLFGQRVLVSAQDARLADGRLAGSMLSMNCAVANVASWTGDLPGALRAASETPAKVLGLSSRKGRLEPGYDADLVLLDDNLKVLRTYVGGREAYGAG